MRIRGSVFLLLTPAEAEGGMTASFKQLGIIEAPPFRGTGSVSFEFWLKGCQQQPVTIVKTYLGYLGSFRRELPPSLSRPVLGPLFPPSWEEPPTTVRRFENASPSSSDTIFL